MLSVEFRPNVKSINENIISLLNRNSRFLTFAREPQGSSNKNYNSTDEMEGKESEDTC